MTYSHLTLAAIHAALQAGDFLKRGFNTLHTITSKEGKQNLVTECDTFSQELILSFLSKQFPSHRFLAEEQEHKLPLAPSSDILWIVDPLDGTVNFAHHIPCFSISIAACLKEEILSGVVFQPMTHELFVAEKGLGAFLNGTPLLVSKTSSLNDALLATGFPYHVHENPFHCIETFSSFLKEGYPIRRLGSAALDLSYVAAGRFDAYWEVLLQPWDVAAGLLLVQEAGGITTTFEGTKRSLIPRGNVLACNPLLHASMLHHLNPKRPF